MGSSNNYCSGSWWTDASFVGSQYILDCVNYFFVAGRLFRALTAAQWLIAIDSSARRTELKKKSSKFCPTMVDSLFIFIRLREYISMFSLITMINWSIYIHLRKPSLFATDHPGFTSFCYRPLLFGGVPGLTKLIC